MRSVTCFGAAAVLALGLAPWVALGADLDADGVDDVMDDCTETANPVQRDTNLDGFGNACDFDFDGDGVVGNADVLALRRAWGASVGDPDYSPDFDFDGDGAIGNLEVTAIQGRYGTPPGPSGLECAGEVPCFAGYVALTGAEEVLSRSVLLRWQSAVPASLFQVERRTPGGAWSLAGRVGGSVREFVDLGPGGAGLAPGAYEYRVRGGGPWSQVLAFTLAEECAGQPATSPSLPVVEIGDSEPDGDHDGDDVEAALQECSSRGGCVLRALPEVYDGVNVELLGESGWDFPQGLVIEGHGSATVFRSRLFSYADHDPSLCPPEHLGLCYRPEPVISLMQLGHATLNGVRFRNFQIDGRKREQRDPGTSQETWQHWGLAARSPVLARTNGGCVHNVTARALMSGGFGVSQADGWIFERSAAIDVGCHDELTPCDTLRRTPEFGGAPGLRSVGYGFIAANDTSGTIVRDSRALRAVKYGVAAVFGARDFRFHRNAVRSGLAAGIQCNGCSNGVIERNLVRSMYAPIGLNSTWPGGFHGEVAHGIQCGGTVNDLVVRDNVVTGGDGSGVRIVCSGPRILVQGNVIDGNCRKLGNSLLVGGSEDVSLLGNVIRDSEGNCQFSVSVNATRGVRIEGGSIESGPAALAGLLIRGTQPVLTSGVVLRNLQIDARGALGQGVRLESTVSGATVYDSVCVAGFPENWLDQSPGGALHLADPGSSCVP